MTALLGLAGCTTFSDFVGDPSIEPSKSPIIAENVRSGRLARLGASQHPRILASYGGEYSNVKLERMVAGIVGKLVTVSDNPNEVYQISILDSPVVNAFALPGGYLYVSRGLLALASDSAELAAVIAHEMGHVTANHGVLRQKKEQEAELAERIVSEAITDKDAGRRALARGRIELAQFSRNQELEADAIGIAAIGEVGYDPYAAAAFQEHMAAFTKYRNAAGINNQGFDFLSTHPSTPQRISLAIGHARKFGPKGTGVRDRESYLSGIDGMMFGDSAAEGFVRGQRYSHANLGITFEFPAGFSIENKPEAVLGARSSDGAAVRFDGDDVSPDQSLTEYIASGWVEGLDVSTVQADIVNGLEAARAKANAGRWDFDIVAIRANNAVYRILTALPAGSQELDSLAEQIRGSFRTLNASERSNLKPLQVRVVRAAANDTIASMAAKMTDVDDPAALFMVLNGLKSGDALIVGQQYKIVTQ
ncbi:MAG: M48 family metalloprotease [Pseudomonadota bacterium]